MTTMLLFVIAATTLLPQSAMAKAASRVVETTTSGGSGGKVGKMVITLGAVGAGAASAHLLRGKLDTADEEGESESLTNGEKEGAKNNNNVSVQPPPPVIKSTVVVKNDNDAKTAETEPLSQEWIEQKLIDAEKRSTVLKDAVKMTQTDSTPTPSTPSSKPKTAPSSKITNNNKQKLSLGPTINTPLVKNLDSKIEHLQKRTSERSLEQQRINNELAQVEQQKKEVANVVAMEKIEAAEREYRARVNGDFNVKSTVTDVVSNNRVVEEVEEEEKGLTIKFGYDGIPAKSKEEDLELTTQVILDHVKTVDGKSGGVVDDEEWIWMSLFRIWMTCCCWGGGHAYSIIESGKGLTCLKCRI